MGINATQDFIDCMKILCLLRKTYMVFRSCVSEDDSTPILNPPPFRGDHNHLQLCRHNQYALPSELSLELIFLR